MPTRRTTTKATLAAAAAIPRIPKGFMDQFVTGPTSAEAVSAASMAPKKALIERALGAELSRKRGYRPAATKPRDADNHRHSAIVRTVPSEDGPLRIETHTRRGWVAAGVTSASSPDRTRRTCARRAIPRHAARPASCRGN